MPSRKNSGEDVLMLNNCGFFFPGLGRNIYSFHLGATIGSFGILMFPLVYANELNHSFLSWVQVEISTAYSAVNLFKSYSIVSEDCVTLCWLRVVINCLRKQIQGYAN